MAASRASSARALRRLSSSRQVRKLHITGAADSSSRAFAIEGASSNQTVPQDIETLRAECRNRSLPANGSRMDLLNRLTSNGSKNHMSTHTTPTRPSPPTATTISSKPTPSTRNINTTRSLKAPKDASTVDFAIMPQEFSGASSSVRTSELSRVPLLHNNYTPDRSGAHAPAVSDFDESAPRGPTIATLAADSTHVSAPSPMADVHDNNAAPVDWHDVAHRMEDVSRSVGERVAARGSEGEAKEDQGVFKQVWEGLVEDVLGRKRVVSP